MGNTNTNTSTAATLPCNTAQQRATLRYIREAIVLGGSHETFGPGDRSAMVAAVRTADIELALSWASGVVTALMLLSEQETGGRYGSWHTAAYLCLRDMGRQAGVIPTI